MIRHLLPFMMVLTISLLSAPGLAGVEPNRYYQSVSDDIVDTLYNFLDNGGITEENAQKSISFALVKVSSRGPIVANSARTVDIKTKAACDLLNQPNLSAIDKCREIIHDIDVVSAYWSGPDPQQPVNTPAVVNQITVANKLSRQRIDAIKAALAKLPLSALRQAADKAARKICNDDWVKGKRDAVIAAIRGGNEEVPDKLLTNISGQLTAENLLRPLVLSFMETMSADELEHIATLDGKSADMRAFSAIIANQDEIDNEISFVVSAEVKAWQAQNPSPNPGNSP